MMMVVKYQMHVLAIAGCALGGYGGFERRARIEDGRGFTSHVQRWSSLVPRFLRRVKRGREHSCRVSTFVECVRGRCVGRAQ